MSTAGQYVCNSAAMALRCGRISASKVNNNKKQNGIQESLDQPSIQSDKVVNAGSHRDDEWLRSGGQWPLGAF
jgi:hypothetical protein